jgi:hypothetical protein
MMRHHTIPGGSMRRRKPRVKLVVVVLDVEPENIIRGMPLGPLPSTPTKRTAS